MHNEGNAQGTMADISNTSSSSAAQQGRRTPVQLYQDDVNSLNDTINRQQERLEELTARLQAIPTKVKELRVPEPKEYKGSRDKTPIREWLQDVEEIFIISNTPLDTKSSIAYAAHYLSEDAKTWYKIHAQQIVTWKDFKTIMINRFRSPREVDQARMKLRSMRQITSVDAYTTAFNKAVLELTEVQDYEVPDGELIFMYREGLKKEIRTLLAAQDDFTSVQDLQTKASKIDASLSNLYTHSNSSGSTFKPQHNKHSSGSNKTFRPQSNQHGSFRPQYNKHSTFNRYPHPSSSNSQSHTGYAPMDTSNSIRQQSRQQLHRIEAKRRTIITGNCYNCRKEGHFAKNCPTKPKDRQRNNMILQEDTTQPEDSVLNIMQVRSATVKPDKKRLISFLGLINNYPAHILVDSGATNNYISEAFVAKHSLYTEPIDEPTEAILANGTSLRVIDMVPHIRIHIQDYQDDIEANVLPLEKFDMVLSMEWLDKYGPSIDYKTRSVTFDYEGKAITLEPVPAHAIVSAAASDSTLFRPNNNEIKSDDMTTILYDRNLTLTLCSIDNNRKPITPMQQALSQIPKETSEIHVKRLVSLLEKHMDIFPAELPSGVPEHVVQHEIDFKPDAKPVKQRPYPLAPKFLPFVKETIDMLMSKGFIRRSTSPSQVPITIADKDGGKDLRFCIDYHQYSDHHRCYTTTQYPNAI